MKAWVCLDAPLRDSFRIDYDGAQAASGEPTVRHQDSSAQAAQSMSGVGAASCFE